MVFELILGSAIGCRFTPAELNTEANSCSPNDSVSTNTLSIIPQFEVPGTHTLMLTKALFRALLPAAAGPEPTETGTTLVAPLELLGGAEKDWPLLPPQPASMSASVSGTAVKERL